MSSVRLRRTVGSSGPCCSSTRSLWSACSSVESRPVVRSAAMTARQSSHARARAQDYDFSHRRVRAMPTAKYDFR